ncbi:MAG: hypothetical protein R6V85_11795 [Polyangia bacterium]
MWRIQRALLDGIRYATVGPASVRDWLDHTGSLHRHFFDAPRRREMQQAEVCGAALPLSLGWRGWDSGLGTADNENVGDDEVPVM